MRKSEVLHERRMNIDTSLKAVPLDVVIIRAEGLCKNQVHDMDLKKVMHTHLLQAIGELDRCMTSESIRQRQLAPGAQPKDQSSRNTKFGYLKHESPVQSLDDDV
jgi:hypothetical protein